MSQTNNTLKPVAEVTAALPPGTPDMQRQHVVTTLQTIVAQQLQINPAQSPVILQTLQQLQQLYDLRTTLQAAATIPGIVSTPSVVASTTPILDPTALALLSGALTTSGGTIHTQPAGTSTPVLTGVQPVPARPVVSQDHLSYGLVQPPKPTTTTGPALQKTVSGEQDRPSFKNPESMRK